MTFDFPSSSQLKYIDSLAVSKGYRNRHHAQSDYGFKLTDYGMSKSDASNLIEFLKGPQCAGPKEKIDYASLMDAVDEDD